MTSRDERQLISKTKIINGLKQGKNVVLEAATGFGKTKVSGDVILSTKIDFDCGVVVPTNRLKKQWIKFTKYLKLEDKIEIFIINTIVKSELPIKKRIWILDEVHLYPLGEEFKKLFEVIDGDYKIALSGTLSKKHKQALLKLEKPFEIVDTITIEESEKNGWCAKTITYNLFVDLDKKEKEDYDKINEDFEKNFAYFESDFDLMKSCQSKYYAEQYVDRLYNQGIIIPNHEKIDLTRIEARKFIQEKAYWGMEHRRKRERFVYDCQQKVKISEELISKFIAKFGNKFITFDKFTKNADSLHDRLSFYKHIKSELYHSNIKAKNIPQSLLIEHELIDMEGQTIPLDFKNIKVGKDRLGDLFISMLDRGDIDGMISAKSLNVGFDAKGVILGLEVNGDGVKEDYQQRKGRSCRKETITYKGQEIDKIACYVNIVLRDTKDESWVKSRQYGSRPARIVNSVDDLIVDFEKVLDNQLNVN